MPPLCLLILVLPAVTALHNGLGLVRLNSLPHSHTLLQITVRRNALMNYFQISFVGVRAPRFHLQTPPMGYSSWNDCGSTVNESWIKATAVNEP